MDSRHYCEILKAKMQTNLKSLGRRTKFLHDNDPKHASKMASKFLSDEKVNLLPWLSMSPDLNPAEHLWGVWKRKVEENKPRSIAKLKKHSG